MKKFVLFIVAIIFLSGCSDRLFNGPEPQAEDILKGGKGTVNIDFGNNNGARTLLPSAFDLSKLYIVLTFTAQGGGLQIIETLDGQSFASVQLGAGIWDLDVKGYATEDDAIDPQNVLVYYTETGIEVISGSAVTITVNLNPHENKLTQNGSGSLSYSITIPAGADGTLKVSLLDGTLTGIPIVLDTTVNQGAIELDSAFYYIIVSVEYGGKAKVWRELAHIYDNAVTEAVYTFTIEDITSSINGVITGFDFSLPNVYYPANNTDNTIAIIVPHGADTSALVPAISHSGAVIDPEPGKPMDFSGPVTYTVYTENGASQSYTVIVSDTIDEIDILAAYLGICNTNTVDNPIPVKVTVDLAIDWSNLLSALSSANRYVALDLSDCTGMTTFDPGTDSAGKNMIVSLVLPDVSTHTITGTSLSYAFNYFSSIKTISGANIETLGNNSFYQVTCLETVNFPALITIGSAAFSGCTNLTGITIPDSVTSIEDSTFRNCTGLTSITIPDSVTSIGGGAFDGCTGLTSVAIGNGVTSIGNQAFRGCDLTIVTIPDSVTSIGSYAFRDCTGLTAINVTDGNTAYNSNNGILYNKDQTVLFFCPQGKTGTVSIPSSVTTIYGAFWGCTGITSITIPDGVTSIEAGTFRNCTGLTSVTIPNSVTSIGGGAFYGCTGLTSITIPNSVTNIWQGAFQNCTGLTSVTIPSSVTGIWNTVFQGCTGLTSVTIPSSVTSIGFQAFDGCTGLISVDFEGNISSSNFSTDQSFPGDLRSKYFDAGGGIGIYTRPSGSSDTWTKL